jgi:hypothetical protein
VQDWFKDAQSKFRVRSAVETVLDANLPKSYDRAVFTEKCNGVFDLMLNYASQGLNGLRRRFRLGPCGAVSDSYGGRGATWRVRSRDPVARSDPTHHEPRLTHGGAID